MINAYTVIGQPIAHSLSPVIHELFGEATQRRIRYTRTESTPESFVQTVLEWRSAGGLGCNVTMPFKEQAFELADRLSLSASRARSVNTLQFHRDGAIVGHNTDGAGLVADLQEHLQQPLDGRRVLLLGAGGAARGAVGPLLDAGVASLTIANRTAARAASLVADFAFADDLAAARTVAGIGFDALDARVADGERFDVIINATSLGRTGTMPPLPEACLADDGFAYDMTYGAGETPFLSWANARGARTAGGFGMLVEQAAEAFEIWEGVRPRTRKLRARLEHMLDADR